ncbi:MAG: [Selenomonadaceae bacterium]|nr:[citrate (pro-3S)-lyase] ligase [Selenomonadaceae bacterium]
MNCNPFTLGHEYLIEYASKKVKKLYIFVVEEDKSEFKFADRFELVKRGVKKFSNVEVLPSGKFIISQQTFSGYFNKENL